MWLGVGVRFYALVVLFVSGFESSRHVGGLESKFCMVFDPVFLINWITSFLLNE